MFGLIVSASDDLLHRRQLIARPQDPEPDRLPHLLHELQVGRHARALGDLNWNHLDFSMMVDKYCYTRRPAFLSSVPAAFVPLGLVAGLGREDAGTIAS